MLNSLKHLSTVLGGAALTLLRGLWHVVKAMRATIAAVPLFAWFPIAMFAAWFAAPAFAMWTGLDKVPPAEVAVITPATAPAPSPLSAPTYRATPTIASVQTGAADPLTEEFGSSGTSVERRSSNAGDGNENHPDRTRAERDQLERMRFEQQRGREAFERDQYERQNAQRRAEGVGGAAVGLIAGLVALPFRAVGLGPQQRGTSMGGRRGGFNRSSGFNHVGGARMYAGGGRRR